MAFGLDATGFTKKQYEDLKTEIENLFKTEFVNIDVDELGPAGQLIGIQSKLLADIWDLAEALYLNMYPISASGVPLDNVADLTGIARLAASKSQVTMSATGDEGTVLAVGRIVEVTGTTNRFISTAGATITKNNAIDVTISVATVLDSTLYTVTIDAVNYTYMSDGTATDLEIAAGLVAAINPTGITATDNLDGTFVVSADDVDTPFITSVDANLAIDSVTSPVTMEAENTGPVVALAGTLTTIVTPISGWSSATNRLDAVLGRDVETDAELRLRRADSLQAAGSATVEAIRAQLRTVTNVVDALVIENDTDATDGDGRPPHSFECIVDGGTDLDIATSIWENKPAGVATYGSTSQNVTDSQGNTQAINFSRATPIYVWVRITRTLNSEEVYPSDGDTQIAADVLALGNLHTIGQDVITQKFLAEAYNTPGLATVVAEVATSAGPGGPPGAYSTANLVIAGTEIALFDSARVSVV